MTASGDRTDYDTLLAVAEEAARAAAHELVSRSGDLAALRIDSKSTATDPVSEADLAAEEAIRRVLAERVPDDGIVGEEGDDVLGTSGRRWIVDPLDGTVNYLYGIPQWCVSVACETVDSAKVVDAGDVQGGCRVTVDVEGNTGGIDEMSDGARRRPVRAPRHEIRESTVRGLVGVIFDPSRDELFAGAADGRATLNGAPLVRAAVPDGGLAHALVATGFGYSANVRRAQAATIAQLLPEVRDIRRAGSAALDIAWLAAGRSDAYYEYGVRAWDTAAGEVIAAAAGLEVHRLDAYGPVDPGILIAPAELVGPLRAIVVP